MPIRQSFIPGAPDGEFPLQNLPYGVFQPPAGEARVGVAIGDQVLDLAALWRAGAFAGTAVEGEPVFHQGARVRAAPTSAKVSGLIQVSPRW